jgi:hypothetical protein
MKLSMVRKVEQVAKERVPEPRTHILWWELDEPRDIVRTRIRAMIASGEASRNDRFIVLSWTRDDDGPENDPGSLFSQENGSLMSSTRF